MIGVARRRTLGAGASGPYVVDSFNRADNPSSLGVADSGQTWSIPNGTIGINGNAAACTSVGGSGGLAIVPLTAADVVVTGTFAGTITDIDLTARYTSASNFYLLQAHTSSTLQLYKCVGGSFTQLGSDTAFSGSAGSNIGLSVKGSAIKALSNGVVLLSVTDSALPTATSVGMRWGATVGKWDAFNVVAS